MDALCSTVQEKGMSAGLDEHPPVETLLPNELMNDDVQVWRTVLTDIYNNTISYISNDSGGTVRYCSLGCRLITPYFGLLPSTERTSGCLHLLANVRV
jgi:hypothetical protein